MTKRELIYTVFEKLNIHSDDTRLSEELVSSLIDTKRAMLLKQQYAKNSWHMPIEIKQELCMDLESVNMVDGYSCAGKILRTKQVLPRSIKIKGKEGPLAVRKVDGLEIAASIVAIERIPFLFENKYTQHLIYCAVDFSGSLYLISKDNKLRFLKSIKVTDIFESPDDASSMQCTIDDNNEVWDNHYPIESAMADVAIDMVVKELTRTLSIPGDNVNDASDGRG
jgi:hypothetical protein|tara:strand:- start:3653 stop:4324 length:672 start_codon:yes stop_codon:yes gene_type:complete